jgi:hypothetical protein
MSRARRGDRDVSQAIGPRGRLGAAPRRRRSGAARRRLRIDPARLAFAQRPPPRPPKLRRSDDKRPSRRATRFATASRASTREPGRLSGKAIRPRGARSPHPDGAAALHRAGEPHAPGRQAHQPPASGRCSNVLRSARAPRCRRSERFPRAQRQWKINRVKVDDGCYEVYGTDAKGQRAQQVETRDDG